MNRILTFSSLAATSSILMTTTALADITASEVWQAWQEDAATMGMSLNGASTTETASGLDVSAMEYTATIPQFGEMEAPLEIRADLGSMTLTDNGDGTVGLIIPDNQTIVVSFTMGEDGGAFSVDAASEGRVTTISGSTDEMVYTSAADKMTWELADWSFTGGDVSTEDLAQLVFEFSMAIEGQSSTYTVDRTNGISVSGTDNTAQLSYNMKMETPDAQVNQTDSLVQTGIQTAVSMTLPAGLDFTSPEGAINALKSGLGFAVKSTAETSVQEGNQMSPLGPVQSKINANDMAFDMTANGGLVQVIANYGATAIDVITPMIPPVSIAADGMAVDMTAPLISDGTRARYMVALNDFTLNDEIWGMFDPTSVLPRDAAQLTLDLSADPAWQIDVLDLAAWENVSEANLPVNPTDIRLDAFELTAAGASLTGTGAMNVDYSGFAPQPAGHIDLAASGLNGLMDNLVAMGLLPEDQVMGARMMMGLFAVPGEGEDTLNSRLEMNEEGHIFANGQRLK